MFGVRHFPDQIVNNWVRDHAQKTDIPSNLTWGMFKRVLTDDVNYPSTRNFDIQSQYYDIAMKAHKSVPRLISRINAIEEQMYGLPDENTRVFTLI